MKFKYKLLLPALFAVLLLASSCNKYLDITPKSSVSEDEMFSSEIGFRQALTGIYSALASRALYGDNLTMGFVSALAQNYNTSGTSSDVLFVPTRAYDYQSSQVLGYTNEIWKSAYTAIAGTNNILKYTEQNRTILSDDSYNQIKGEALALRALLHFELIRIFAPSYLVGSSAVAIPYRKTMDHLSRTPSTVSEVINFALEDLTIAAELLKKSDPILKNTTERQVKLNYYAVRGLQARINLYKGATLEAYAAAKEVVDSEAFPFVVPSSVSAAAASKNRLFKSENVFLLRNRQMATWAVDQYFTFRGNISYRLTRPEADLRTIYEVAAGNDTDMRYVNLFEDNQGFKFPSKFWQTNSSTIDSLRLDQMVPVIRITELRYIMAEASTSLQESLEQINLVRKARNIPILPTPSNLTKQFIQNEITKEYQKEFYAEGQLFFYYKRLNFESIQFQVSTFNPKVYVLPIPEDELEFNPNFPLNN